LIHSYYFSKNDPWGAEGGGKFGLGYLQKNISDNVGFWIAGYPSIEHPFLFTIFALIGLVYSFKKDRKVCLFLLTWFGSFFLLYAFFYAGSVRYGVDVRYALSEYPPLILLAGYGVYAAIRVISKKSKGIFNENLRRSQDLEFNLRIKKAGGKIILFPDMIVFYYPQATFENFFKHNLGDGIWSVYPLKFIKTKFKLRHYIPLFFVLTLPLSIWPYIPISLFFSLKIAIRENDLRFLFLMPIAFFSRHFGYGLGSIWGLVKLII